MAQKTIHQVIESITASDAVSDHAFLMQDWLRELGFVSEIFVGSSGSGLKREVQQFTPAAFSQDDLVVYHHSIGSQLIEHLLARQVTLLMMYQNVTPPEFYETADPALAAKLVKGREQLQQLRPFVKLALAASPYSETELMDAGFERTGVLPLTFKDDDYELNRGQISSMNPVQQGPMLLFLGRVAPNKRQEDVIKLLFYLRRISPAAHLVLVGGQKDKGYLQWLQFFVRKLGLQEAVRFAGHIDMGEIPYYYRAADLFVSMSEHEGFCKPLIESMHFKLPIMAYASSAVPSTLGQSGVLFTEKNYEALAELADILIQDQTIRQRIIAGQTRRLQDFLEPNVRNQFHSHLRSIGVI